MAVRSVLCGLFAIIIFGMLPSQATPVTITSSSSSGGSSSMTMVNGRLVDASCSAHKNGVNANCGNPVLNAVPDVFTTVTPGFVGFGSFAMPGFPGFPPIPPVLPTFPTMAGFGPAFGTAASLTPFRGYPNFHPRGLF